MGYVRKGFGNVTIETRRESFVVHMSYGYSDDGVSEEVHPLDVWREVPHPEFMNEDLDDLITALVDFRDSRSVKPGTWGVWCVENARWEREEEEPFTEKQAKGKADMCNHSSLKGWHYEARLR